MTNPSGSRHEDIRAHYGWICASRSWGVPYLQFLQEQREYFHKKNYRDDMKVPSHTVELLEDTMSDALKDSWWSRFACLLAMSPPEYYRPATEVLHNVVWLI